MAPGTRPTLRQETKHNHNGGSCTQLTRSYLEAATYCSICLLLLLLVLFLMHHCQTGSVATAAGATTVGAALAGAAVTAPLDGHLKPTDAGHGGGGSEDHGLDAAVASGFHIR